jgi:hypothetical protein
VSEKPTRLWWATGAALALAGLGWFLASEWYADDACPRDQWQCDAGATGMFLFFLGATLSLIFILLGVGKLLFRRRGPQ